MGNNKEVGTHAAETAHAPYHAADAGGIEDMATSTPKRTPAFQFYPNDFFGSSKVQRMSLTERGAYITLLATCWLDNGLPTDLTQLAALLHVKWVQFDRMWSGPLHECFYERSGKLHNRRLDAERQKQADFRRRQSDNGKLGGRPRKANGNPEEATGYSGLTQTEPKKSSSSSSPSSSSISSSKNTNTAAMPRRVEKASEPNGDNYRVIEALAIETLKAHGAFPSESDFVDAVKLACAQRRIDYGREVDPDVVHRACASASFKHRVPDLRQAVAAIAAGKAMR